MNTKQFMIGSKAMLLMTIGAMGTVSAMPVMAAGTQSVAPVQRVSGQVVDASGEPIPGVSVLVKGTSEGMMTDIDGKFELQVAPGSTLVFSFIGYISEEVAATANMNVVLREDTEQLEEVVIVGYGVQKRKNFTGSVSTINMEDSPVSLMPTTNAMDYLRGTATGLTVSQQQGAGQSPSILVRGQKSVNGGSDPLIVMDGVIFNGSLRDIDQNIIESMSVLKDATSLAAYGSQAANGVIMITTKQGKQGKPMINVNANWAFSGATMRPDMLSTDDYVKKINLLKGLGEKDDPSWMKPFEYENYKNGHTTDMYDYCLRTGVMQNYSASISGANEKINYFMSAAYADQVGLVKGDDYDRLSLTARLQSDITSWLQIGSQMSYSANDYSGASVYDLFSAAVMSPYARPDRADGKGPERYPLNEGLYRANPLWAVNSGTVDDHDTYATTILKGHILLKCPWLKGLTFRMNGSWTRENVERDYFTHEGYYVQEGESLDRYSDAVISGYLAQANGYSARTVRTSWVWDNILDYNHQWGKHFLDLTYVYTRDSKKYDYRYMSGSDFSALGNSNLSYNGLTYAGTQKINNIDYTLHNDVGYLWRASYNYDDTYHASVSVRRDGSSVFGADHKWGVFPAVGLAWTVSNEEWLKKVEAISYLKVKASWGKNGNQSLAPYQTLSTINLGQKGGYSYTFGNTSQVSWGQRVTAMGNSELGWEETESWNYGFELGLLKDRIHLEVDAYTSKTTNQIFNREIPIMGNGLTSISATMGQVDNWGVEANLTTQNIKTKNFAWTSTLSFYMNRNKLVDLYGNGKDDINASLFLGESLGAIYGYKPIGIVQVEDTDYISANGAQAGDPKYWDKDGDGKITAEDRAILGFKKENFRMAFSNTFRYKDFELYALFTGLFGGHGYARAVNTYAFASLTDIQTDNGLDHPWWTPENRSNTYPRVNYYNANYTPVQGYGFVRLQDLSLSYTFRQPWVKKSGIAGLKAFVAGKNLVTFTGWEGGDPEVQQTLGWYSYGYPLSRSFSLGFNLTF